MVSMSKMPPSRLTISISYSNALSMKVISCRYGWCRRRLDAVIGENVIFDFIFFLTIVLMKKSEKILKNTSHEGCPVRIFSGSLEPYFMVKKYFKNSRIFLLVLEVKHYLHILVEKRSSGDAFYVIFSYFLKM